MIVFLKNARLIALVWMWCHLSAAMGRAYGVSSHKTEHLLKIVGQALDPFDRVIGNCRAN